MKARLDTKSVATLTLGEGHNEAFFWDTELPGFGLRLQGQGRAYVAQYRASGRTRRVTLGTTSRLTLTQAREAARRLLARVTLGEDPQGVKATKRAKAELTFQKVANAYLKAKQSKLRPASFKVTKLYLTGDYFKPLHPIGITEITHPDIAARLSAITDKRSENTSAAARRAISALFTWAMEEGWAAANPVIGTRKPADPESRERVLSDAELRAIWLACENDDFKNDDFSRIVRLLILLGSRRQEVGGMRWSELDMAAGTWTLPSERSKNHRANMITLPAPALAVIGSGSLSGRVGDRDHMFGSRGKNGFTGWHGAWDALERRLDGAIQPWRLHDIRRTVATRMGDIGVEPHVIEAILNHYSGHRKGPAGVYNKSPYEPQVKAALARWAERVAALVEGRESNVVAFPA